SIDFPGPVAIAGVTLRVSGNPPSALPYQLAVRTAKGEQVFARRTIGPGWVTGAQLCPIVPTSSPILGTGIVLSGAEPLQGMTVWAIDESQANSSRQR
ncbi:MAG TPA: hypothetical protein VNT26_16095, partial [Candidatus Sulfotelmatobacter sp.]|nr:hypothetical protein [Candidatus Sulfotelmatobacter sp.]